MTLRVIFSILNNLSLRRNINLNIRKFTRANKPLFWQKWTPDVFSYFRPPCLCPSEGHKHGVSILSSSNLCGTFCQITRVRNAAQTWHLDRCLIYLSSIPCQFLDFIHGMVLIFFFNGVTVKTENCSSADSIEHTFIDCRESVKLYSQIISWFNQCQRTTITLSNEQIVFGDIHHVTDPERRRLDLFIILVKQYIYSSKHLQKELS